MAAAVFLLTADAVLNKQLAMATLQQLDWSVIVKLYAIFVWMYGFHKTRTIEWIWSELNLRHSNYDDVTSIAFLVVVILIATNIGGGFIVTIMALELLVANGSQLSLILLVMWVTSIGGNLTLFGCVANFIVVGKAQQLTKYRMSFWSHFQFGFLTTVLSCSLGVVIICGILQVGQ